MLVRATCRYHPPLARRLLKLAALRPGMAVLDVACGTGLVLLDAAATVGPSGRAAGVDLSAQMLKQVRTCVPSGTRAGIAAAATACLSPLRSSGGPVCAVRRNPESCLTTKTCMSRSHDIRCRAPRNANSGKRASLRSGELPDSDPRLHFN